MTDYIIDLDESKLFENQSILAKKLVHCRDCKHRTHDKTCIKVMKRKPDEGYCDEGELKQY